MDRKIIIFVRRCYHGWSLSARRAWIEKFWGSDSLSANASLSARRAWIEKLYTLTRCASHRLSLSARRAWIEKMINQKKSTRSLSARRAWIEKRCWAPPTPGPSPSLSARRAWIENIMFVNLRVVDGSRSPQGERG